MLKPAAIVLITASLVILPWTIRNFSIYKRFIFITTSSGDIFGAGIIRDASGTALTVKNESIIERAPKEFRDKLFSLNEIGQYDFFYSETLKFIKANPGFFIKMVLKKIYYFWWFAPQAGLLYPHLWLFIYKLYYGGMLSLFLIGLYAAFSRLSKERLPIIISILSVFLLISFIHGLYYVEIRHRWGIEPLMLIFSAYGLMFLYQALKRPKARLGAVL